MLVYRKTRLWIKVNCVLDIRDWGDWEEIYSSNAPAETLYWSICWYNSQENISHEINFTIPRIYPEYYYHLMTCFYSCYICFVWFMSQYRPLWWKLLLLYLCSHCPCEICWFDLCSHRENHWSADCGWQNTRGSGKPPLYNHVENNAKFRLGPAEAQKFSWWLIYGLITTWRFLLWQCMRAYPDKKYNCEPNVCVHNALSQPYLTGWDQPHL